jgi:hypothetical protein
MSSGLVTGDEGQEKILELLAFGKAQPAKMNAHLVATGNADDRTTANDRRHGLCELEVDVHQRANGNDSLGLHKHAFHADIHTFGFDDLPLKRSIARDFTGTRRGLARPNAVADDNKR